jgi:aminoglycoside phosphotransferase (APT) family kinase protein
MTDTGEAAPRPRTSTRDHHDLHRRLAAWLATQVPGAEISQLIVPQSNGMSSETLLFDAHWPDAGGEHREACAARLPPASDAIPVFPVYDLGKQFRVMRLVAERTDVPVPRPLWFEDDDGPLGVPFFVMERVEGEVPPDLMPYTFGSWLLDASEKQQRRLQDSSVRVLAALHGIDARPDELAFLELDRRGVTALRRHVEDQRAYYEWVVADAARSPLIERGFAWLESHWPTDDTASTISWGDARVGNVIYRAFEPAAVLDWEMAATGPREIDLGWMIYLHRFFQDLTEEAGLPGMPGFMRADDVAATYEAQSGWAPRDLQFFVFYAALRHGIVMARVMRRAVAFGEAELPDDPDDLITHRRTIEAMIDGSYWSRL